AAPPANDDPCVLPPGSGYRGIENHLYRVQIVEGGAPGIARFAWSRDNASVAARVTKIAGSEVTIAFAGRATSECFHPDDWVEVLNDTLERSGRPGAMRRVKKV